MTNLFGLFVKMVWHSLAVMTETIQTIIKSHSSVIHAEHGAETYAKHLYKIADYGRGLWAKPQSMMLILNQADNNGLGKPKKNVRKSLKEI